MNRFWQAGTPSTSALRRWVFLFTLLANTQCTDTHPVRLATTTSVEDSGLLDALLPVFEKSNSGIPIAVLAVGSGEALRLARQGDVDVVISHSPAAESTFVAGGNAVIACTIMRNDFVVVGPADDPAHVRAQGSAAGAFSAIRNAQSSFVSRGDSSGTHVKELEIWRASGASHPARNYLEVGQGMGETLIVAVEAGAYTLTDRATYNQLSHDVRARMPILHAGDDQLQNRYRVIVARRGARSDKASVFARWLVSREAQTIIGQFGRANGISFIPAASC